MADRSLTTNQRSALERAKRNPELRPLLFRKASGIEWFPALQEAGFVRPEEIPSPIPAKDPGYVTIPVWPITDYLVNASQELREPGNQKYVESFLKFIRIATESARLKKISNYRVWWQFAKILRNVPAHYVVIEDLGLCDYWLEDPYERGVLADALGDWLAGLLDAQDEHSRRLSLALLDVLYRTSVVKRPLGNLERKEVRLRFDAWHARNLTKKVAAAAAITLGADAVRIFQTRVEHMLVEEQNDKWSCVWRPAIEDHDQNKGHDDFADVLIEAHRDAVLALVDKNTSAGTSYVGALLDAPFVTLRRIAIHVIRLRFKPFQDVVTKVVNEPFFYDSNYRHELWQLLHHNYPWFSRAEQRRVQQIVCNLKRFDDGGSPHDGATAYFRAVWLAAIKDFSDELTALYQASIKVIGNEPEHPDFASYMTVGWVDHKSPIPQEDLIALSTQDLVATLKEYRDPQRFREPGIEGLTKALGRIIKADPQRFLSDLQLFAELHYPYIHEVIERYSELWSSKTQLPWDDALRSLFTFIEDVIGQERFWREDESQKPGAFIANRHWVVSAVARLIENGMRADEHAFPESFLPRSANILFTLLAKESGEEFKPQSDAVSIAINSPRGRCLEALINLTLRDCRLTHKETGRHADAWAKYEPFYEDELEREREHEFPTLVVNYLPNFLYMSQDWVIGRLARIFDKSNYQRWLCAMQGYAYVSTVYEPIFKYLKDEGHFLRALEDPNLRDRVREKVVQNIVVAYLHDFESLDDPRSLISSLLTRQDSEELGQLIWFIWTLRNATKDVVDTRKKVFELWRRIAADIDAKGATSRDIAAKLSAWIAFVDEVNQTTKPLIFAILPFAGEHHHSFDLLESIAKISERQPHEAYEIWSRLLDSSAPDYPQEALKKALSNLRRSGPDGVRQSKDIASRYVKVGNEQALRSLHELEGESP